MLILCMIGFSSTFTPPIRVIVTDGNYIYCTSYCQGITWTIQGKTFKEDLGIINLGGCDIVLGNDWMKKYNPVKFDHEKNIVTIGRKGNKVVFKGHSTEGRLNLLSSSSMGKLIKKGHSIMAHLFMVTATTSTAYQPIEYALQELLHKYDDIFAEPTTLPPERAFDHTIPLKSGAALVSLRPYKYNYYQKDEIEKQVREMMATEIIQKSQSLFYSPALLVKKKDGTWRFCVDYKG